MTILTHELKSGRMSGCSAQHCRIMLMASGGAAPLETDGRISGGGFFSLDIISSADNDNIQYGSPRTTTSCIIIPNEYTSPGCVPNLLLPFEFRNSSGDVHNNSVSQNLSVGRKRMAVKKCRKRKVCVCVTIT